PIIDIILSDGKGYAIAYISHTGSKLVFDFFTFFGPDFKLGATYGLRIEMAIILLAIGYYIWLERKSLLQSISAVFISYVLIFFSFIIPGLIYTFSHIHNTASTFPDVVKYLAKII